MRHQDFIWWIILAITIASYLSCLGDIEYQCLTSSFEYLKGKGWISEDGLSAYLPSDHCASAPGPIKFQRLTLRGNMILDVVTDAISQCQFSDLPYRNVLIDRRA